MTKCLMFQGTGSDVGKSLIVAGLCRAYANRGLKVRPFKPQNMSNNAAVSIEGGEIGRAQALQARAARVRPSNLMNPVLLKPERETGSQVIVNGKRIGSFSAREYVAMRDQFMPQILASFKTLARDADLILVEGAGSPAEVNLRAHDIANMGFARAGNVPVVLVGDIHRGGILASVIGTFDIIDPDDALMIVATLVNKFHGDVSLFDAGVALMEARTGVPCLGVVPHFAQAHLLPAEDSVALEERVSPVDQRAGKLVIAVPKLSRISNFDDCDPLMAEPDVEVIFVRAGEVIPACDLILIPGSKASLADADFIRAQGWDIDIKAHYRRGGHVLGLCGGYQILGRSLSDPDGIEGMSRTVEGLGLLDIETVMGGDKRLSEVRGIHRATGQDLSGYEMHIGASEGPDRARSFASIERRDEGACSVDGRVVGTYLHGIFAGDEFRRAFLAGLGLAQASSLDYEAQIDRVLDALADHLEQALDLDALLDLCGTVGGS